jgi:hypothetical protein
VKRFLWSPLKQVPDQCRRLLHTPGAPHYESETQDMEENNKYSIFVVQFYLFFNIYLF